MHVAQAIGPLSGTNTFPVGRIGPGTTLHGLRVSYAAGWQRYCGATDREVADLLGDASKAMGGHHTRHVVAELNIIRAFDRIETGKKPRRRKDKA